MLEAGRIIFSDSMDAFNNYVRPHSILMRLDNAPQAADLLGIKGVTKVDFLNEKQVRVYFDGDEDIAEKLAAASTHQGWKLREISLDKSLLDDIFKQLSDQTHV
jgi:ABC-2 type transport system ATP-binding protein